MVKKYNEEIYKLVGKLDDDRLLEVNLVFKSKLTEDQIKKLDDYLIKNNLLKKRLTNFFVRVEGTHKKFCELFGTELCCLEKDGRSFHCNTGDIIIPEEIDFILCVIGLDNTPKFSPSVSLSLVDPTDCKTGAYQTNEDFVLPFYNPIQLGKLYDFPMQYKGENQIIAVLELEGGYIQSDLDYYFKTNLQLFPKQPQIIYVSVDGQLNTPEDNQATNETYLDIEIIGGIVPAAKQIIYNAPNSELGFYNAIFEAINSSTYPPCAFNISWGAIEPIWNPAYITSIDLLMQQAITQNINVMAASGDFGSSGAIGVGGYNVYFPASSPNVVACGGTRLKSTKSYIYSEVTWNFYPNAVGATGGGFSIYFPLPAYQTIPAPSRGVPDVSANAVNYLIYKFNKFYLTYGTSGVAPMYCALVAQFTEAKGPINFLNTYLYPNASTVCVDITVGGNNLYLPGAPYNAAIGWDACTGLGRIIGNELLNII